MRTPYARVRAMAAVLPQPYLADDHEALADQLEPMRAEDVVAWAADRFGDRIVLTCSWQKQSSILVHLVSEIAPGLRIVELDTGLLFPEAHETRERLVERYGVEVETVRPPLSLEEQD